MEYIAIVEIAFRGACVAVNVLRNGLHYSNDAERLVLNLEMERFRLHIWGENSGLTPTGGGQPSLPSRLLSISDVLSRHLDGIRYLIQDADMLRDRYGLVETEAQPTNSAKVKVLMERMQKSIRSSGIEIMSPADGGNDENEPDVENAIGDLDLGKKKPPSTSKRIRWAVRDLKKFNALVVDLGSRITKLDQLLTESQQVKAQEDNERVSIVLVDSVTDQPMLELLLAAVKAAPATSQTRSRVESKAISADLAWSPPAIGYTLSLQPTLSNFTLPEAYSDMKRFVTMKKTDSEAVYLFERKDFDPNISHDDKEKLVERIQRLVMLLSKPKTPAFRTPVAEGCIHDPSRFCWWMVFRLPAPLSPASTAPRFPPREPVSLLSLLQPKAKFRPPLEQRYALASRLCTTLSELYSSSWLHKGIRSENVLFADPAVPSSPPTPAQSSMILQSQLLCGFDYSRQESERSTIDKSRLSGDVSTAIYRHPCYQGEAAEGYKIQYDIYSLGLVLVEIALWMPLSSFLEGKPTGGSKRSGASDDAAKLSPDMKVFHERHAAVLKKRVVSRVDSEFGFRVGSPYYEATKFCLEFADRNPPNDKDSFPAHPALEFYNNVVVPLSRLAKGHFKCGAVRN